MYLSRPVTGCLNVSMQVQVQTLNKYSVEKTTTEKISKARNIEPYVANKLLTVSRITAKMFKRINEIIKVSTALSQNLSPSDRSSNMKTCFFNVEYIAV